MKNKFLYIKWVKTHVGIYGNERADSLAKQVLEENDEFYDHELDIPYPISYLKKNISKKIDTDWQEHWDNSEKGRDTYKIIKKINRNYLCKNQVSLYFLTGHGSFPSYLFKINKKDDDLCVCGSTGNPQHYLFGRCSLIKNNFNFNTLKTLRQNMYEVLHDESKYKDLNRIYNILNKKYSFINFIF